MLKRWNSYWFSPALLFNLAICRIVIVGYQLVHLETRYNYFLAPATFPDFLYDPLVVLQLLIGPFGMEYRPPLEVLIAIYWVTLIAGVLAFIGLKTRLSLGLFALGNTFLQAYAYSFGDMHHPDALMMISLGVLALSPVGGVLSVDDLRRRVRTNVGQGEFQRFDVGTESSAFARWPLLLIQFMFALIYFDGAISKLQRTGLDWMNGYTLQYYMVQDGLRPWGSDLAIWLSQYHTLAVALSWMTILFEGTFFIVLLFPRLARFYIPLGASLHMGIFLTMGASFLGYIAIYSVFIPWILAFKTLSQRLKFLRCTGKSEVLFNGRCSRCIRSMTVLRYFDWLDRLGFAGGEARKSRFAEKPTDIVPEDRNHKLLLRGPEASVQRGFPAFREISRCIPILWPLWLAFKLPLGAMLGRKMYTVITRRKARFHE